MNCSPTGRFLWWLACTTPVALNLNVLESRAQSIVSTSQSNAVRAEVAKPEQRSLTRELDIPATLIADEDVALFAKVSGYVGGVNVDIGSRVRKGDVLVKLDVPEMADQLRIAESVLEAKRAKVRAFEAKVAQARRMVETARATLSESAALHELDELNLARNQELRDGNAISEQEMDEARSAHKVTEAKVAIAKARLASSEAEREVIDADRDVAQAGVLVSEAELLGLKTLMGYASIRAPFDGVITERNVDHGAFVRSAAEGAANSLLRIAKTDRIRIAMDIPESDAPFVRAGTPVRIRMHVLGDAELLGTVARTAGALRPQTRTLRAEVDVDNSDGRLTPGMYAQLVVELESKEQALFIPSKAIRVRDKRVVVYIVADGVAEVRAIEIGYDDGIWAEVLAGLDGTELVISATKGAIAPGKQVVAIMSDS